MFVILVGALGSGAVSACQRSQPEAAFVQWVSTHALPLNSVEPDAALSDLRALRTVIGSARVVALGEPAHGLHEALALRNRLFTYLVEEGFTAIAIESGFAEADSIGEFVAGATGDAATLVSKGLTYGFGRFDENRALIQWMHDYNADPAHRRKLRFYGIDISLGGPRTATPTPVPLESVLTYLDYADGNAAQALREGLTPWFERLRTTNPEWFSAEDHAALTAAINDVIAVLERNRAALTAKTSVADYDWAYRKAISARQADDVFRVMAPPADDRIPAGAWRQMEARDQAMADTVRWILDQEGPDGRVLVFAHNTHIQGVPLDGGLWADLEKTPDTAGVHLRSMMGDDVVIIGTTTGSRTDDAASVGVALARVGTPLFAIDLRPARTEASVMPWLQQPRRLTSAYSNEVIVPAAAFDALVYVEAMRPTVSR